MLKLLNVGVTFADKQIVEGVSVEIRPGSIYVMMGPNGSGKSTLSLALAGHPYYSLTPKSEIWLNKTDLVPLLPHERAKAGLFLTFQSPVAIPGVSVKQLLKIMVESLTGTKLVVKDFLTLLTTYSEVVGIRKEQLERSIHEGFSGGEKKRLEMMALLLAKPKYAILDEIDSGLDVDAIKMIAAAVKMAQKEFGTGFLMVTHYQRILNYLKVDGVHVLANGKLRASGNEKLIKQIETEGYKGIL